MLGEILDDLLTSPSTGPCITATRHFAAKPPVLVPFPPSLDPRIADGLRARGIHELYSHQARAWELIEKGHHVVVVTPTASGKTLCYNLPALQSLLQHPDARVLYLFPTKALAQDQLAELEALAKALPEMRMFTYDGDTPQDARRAVRARANLVLTNPDMLHSGILPHHTKWATLFQNLRYIVIDELHAYRGVFGSHLANVLRRLRRICRHYGSDPQFIMASATIANPAELARRLTGEHVEEIAESGAPTGDKTFVCYNPPVVNPELGIRAPYLGEAAKLAIRLLRERIPTIVFAARRTWARRRSSRFGSSGSGSPRSSSPRAASRPRCCWRPSRPAWPTRPATAGSFAATAAAISRRAGGRSRRACATATCSASSPRARSNSVSTSAISTSPSSPATRERSPR